MNTRCMKRLKTDLAVIGGGAAGMMSAITAAENGARVLLLERGDRLGAKLRITGKGRCNLLNHCDIEQVLKNVPRNSRFLFSALRAFDPSDTMRFFEQIGVPLKTERGNRVFPVSDKAADVADALLRKLKALGVTVLKTRAAGISAENGQVTCIRTPQGDIQCRSAILCTGGVSYPKTGSTGDGYKFAQQLGHTLYRRDRLSFRLNRRMDFARRCRACL